MSPETVMQNCEFGYLGRESTDFIIFPEESLFQILRTTNTDSFVHQIFIECLFYASTVLYTGNEN